MEQAMHLYINVGIRDVAPLSLLSSASLLVQLVLFDQSGHVRPLPRSPFIVVNCCPALHAPYLCY